MNNETINIEDLRPVKSKSETINLFERAIELEKQGKKHCPEWEQIRRELLSQIRRQKEEHEEQRTQIPPDEWYFKSLHHVKIIGGKYKGKFAVIAQVYVKKAEIAVSFFPEYNIPLQPFIHIPFHHAILTGKRNLPRDERFRNRR